MVFLISHISGHRRTWCLNETCLSTDDVKEALIGREGYTSGIVLQYRGQILTNDISILPKEANIVATLRLPGGKGGFGSMLRAIGAQIEKTTNREACRDLSGRRLRDINEEKRLKEFISKKAEREREIQEKKRQKFEQLKETPKHIFQDETYYQQRETREKNLFDSLDKAFSKDKDCGSSGIKRSCEAEAKPVAKLKKGRFMVDLDDSSEDSDSDDESPDNSVKTKRDIKDDPKKIKSTNKISNASAGEETPLSSSAEEEEKSEK